MVALHSLVEMRSIGCSDGKGCTERSRREGSANEIQAHGQRFFSCGENGSNRNV